MPDSDGQLLAAQVQSRVNDALPGVTWLYGRRHLSDIRQPATVVWVRPRDAFVPSAKATTNPRGRLDRMVYLEAHVWGATEYDAERIEKAIVLAASAYAQGSLEVGNAEWVAAEKTSRGEFVVVALGFRQPVAEPDAEVALITDVGFDNSDAVARDGVMQCDEGEG
jgi:hypothetical protein